MRSLSPHHHQLLLLGAIAMLKRLAVESDYAYHDIINFLGTFISTTREKYYY